MVHCSYDVGVALSRLRQGTHKIHMHMFKALMRNGDEDDEAVHVRHNLAPAAELTIFAPFKDVLC